MLNKLAIILSLFLFSCSSYLIQAEEIIPKELYCGSTMGQFLKSDKNKVLELFGYNFAMLAIGYLHEIGLVHIALSTFIGFGFFFMLFVQIYNYYVKQSSANYLIFYSTFSSLLNFYKNYHCKNTF